MITNSVSAWHVDVTLDPWESLRLLQTLGISAENVCKVSVNIVRSPIDMEKLYEKLRERGDDSSLELFPQCDDVDCK